MINAAIKVNKRLLLKDIHRRNDKNIYRTNYFFNFAKFRKNKWGYQRARWFKQFTFCRYDPSITYIFTYDHYFSSSFNSINFYIRKNLQNLTYKSMLFFVRTLRLFFYVSKNKQLRDRLVYRRSYQNFNVIDTYLDIFLLRMGGAKHIRTARQYVMKGAYFINSAVVKNLRHLSPFDVVKFSQKNVKIDFQRTRYNKELGKYISMLIPYKSYFLTNFLKAVPTYRVHNVAKLLNRMLAYRKKFSGYMSKVLEFITLYTIEKNDSLLSVFVPLINFLDRQLYKQYLSFSRPKQSFKLSNLYNFGKHFNFYNSVLFEKSNAYLLKYLTTHIEPVRFYAGFYKIFTAFSNVVDSSESMVLRLGEKNFWQDLLPFTFSINWSNMSLVYFDLPFRNQWHIYICWYKLRRFLRYNR